MKNSSSSQFHYVPLTVNLKTTMSQYQTLAMWAGSARFVYNMMLSVCRTAFQTYFPEKIKEEYALKELCPVFLECQAEIEVLLQQEKERRIVGAEKALTALTLNPPKNKAQQHIQEKETLLATLKDKPVGQFFNPSDPFLLCNILAVVKKKQIFPFLQKVSSLVLQDSVRHLATAFKRCQSKKAKYPQFKKKFQAKIRMAFPTYNALEYKFYDNQSEQYFTPTAGLGKIPFRHTNLGPNGNYAYLLNEGYIPKTVTIQASAKITFTRSALTKEQRSRRKRVVHGWEAVIRFVSPERKVYPVKAVDPLSTLPSIKDVKLTLSSLAKTKTTSVGVDVGHRLFLNLSHAVNGSHFEALPASLARWAETIKKVNSQMGKNRLNTEPEFSHKAVKQGETHTVPREKRLEKGISLKYSRLRRQFRQLHHRSTEECKRFFYEIAYDLFKHYDVIFYEKLNLTGLSKSAKGTTEEHGTNVKQKSALNRQWRDGRYGLFFQILENVASKLRFAGLNKHALPVNNRYTSQHCLQCGTTDRLSRKGIVFRCTHCGHEAHADINAALNIEALGLHTYSSKFEAGGCLTV